MVENGVNITDKHASFFGSIFSNWAKCSFNAHGRQWDSSEQYFMWLKAKHFGDDETAEKITMAVNPEIAKKLGREVKHYNENEWIKVREDYMYIAVHMKFSRCQELKNKLLDKVYDNKIFVEGSPFDKVWGVGIIWNSPEIEDEANWQGLNLLGKTLNKVRETLK